MYTFASLDLKLSWRWNLKDCYFSTKKDYNSRMEKRNRTCSAFYEFYGPDQNYDLPKGNKRFRAKPNAGHTYEVRTREKQMRYGHAIVTTRPFSLPCK
jgi:predicted Zn-dependent protease